MLTSPQPHNIPPYLYGSNGQYGFLFPLRTEYLFLENDLDHQRSIRLSLPKENYTILEIGSMPEADRLYSNSVTSSYLPLTFESFVSTSRVLSKFKQNLWPVTTSLFIISLVLLWLGVSYWHAKKEIALQKAVREAQFFPYYQPIVDAQTGTMLGVKALLRWLPSDGRVIEPLKFIHYLEQSGDIIPTTENLITTIYHDLSSLMSQNDEFYCSVNITPLHLQNDDFYHYLKRFHHDYSKLTLELTERQPIENLALASQRLALLKTLGLKISLDDAGTGYGGNSYLHYFDIDTIKIDKMFTRSIDEGRSAVLDGYIEMAKQLELNLVAEGVENKLEAKGLILRGIFQHQGYYYAKPMSIEDLHRWALDYGYPQELVSESC
ncbi:EAL domain-containing protein [Vibrio chagasii]|uniref:EAL domain-containing protein n=1 Tax=Vibrio chagasii TaxID=170679 RepID=UPI004067B3AC